MLISKKTNCFQCPGELIKKHNDFDTLVKYCNKCDAGTVLYLKGPGAGVKEYFTNNESWVLGEDK